MVVIDGIFHKMEMLNSLYKSENKDSESILTDIKAISTIAASPISSIIDLVKNNATQLTSWIRNRHFVFLK